MKNISRRKFIGNTAKGAAVVSVSGLAASCSFLGGSEEKVPRRVLGKTGLELSVLSFGGGSQFARNKTGKWEELLEEAIESGINLFDTAPSYSTFKLKSEKLGSDERYATILPKYRDKVIISTKLETRDPKKVKEEFEASLKRLKVDYVDIYLMHAINNSDDVATIEKGIYSEIVKLKKAGLVKYIGFSSMDSAQRSKDLLDNLDIDVALLAMNPTKYGDYADVALPSAIKQNTGVMAMKVMRNIVGKDATPNELFDYALGHKGVATALIGHYGIDVLKENIAIAKKYKEDNQLTLDRQELESRLASYAGPHALVWAQPGYTDGEWIA